MKQVSQRPKDGDISVVDVPVPALRSGWLLVTNRFYLISAGTERTKIVTGETNLPQKARVRPDLVNEAVGRGRVERGAATGVARDRLFALALSATRPPASCSRSGRESRGSPPATRSPAEAAAGRITSRSSPSPRASSFTFA